MTRLTKAIRALSKGLLATLIVFLGLEGLLRLAYLIRNSAVEYVPLPYVIGHSYGPIPPWQDGLRILKSDDALIWRHRPNVHRK